MSQVKSCASGRETRMPRPPGAQGDAWLQRMIAQKPMGLTARLGTPPFPPLPRSPLALTFVLVPQQSSCVVAWLQTKDAPRAGGHSGGIGISIAGDERRPGRSVWAFRAMLDRALPPSMGAVARRRRQASARPLVGPPNTPPVLSAPGWWICLFQI